MKETEVKFKIENSKLIENKIEGLNAKYQGTYSQLDIWFDNPSLKLKERGAGVRLRKENKMVTITLKHKLIINKSFRSAEEVEFEVGDFDKAKVFLGGLGFREDYQLKKKRKIWKVNRLELALDIVDGLGKFLEIEGKKGEIEKVIKKLGLDTLPRITKHYGQLYAESILK
jgi:predicted adenylyl cyclase CyaB